ncbi:MAG: hypothetical protein J0L99_18870 [Chitinophagales bacterium]|nr:hypothetical protein [Chitinophagales bacterium]
MDIGVFKIPSLDLAEKLNGLTSNLDTLNRIGSEAPYRLAGMIIRPGLPNRVSEAERNNPTSIYYYFALRGKNNKIYASRTGFSVTEDLMASDLSVETVRGTLQPITSDEEASFFDNTPPIDLVYVPLQQLLFCASIAGGPKSGGYRVDPDFYGYYSGSELRPEDISLSISTAFIVITAPDAGFDEFTTFKTFKLSPLPAPQLSSDTAAPSLAYELGVACPPRWNPAGAPLELATPIDPHLYESINPEFIIINPRVGPYTMAIGKRFFANKLSWPLVIATTLAVGQLTLSLFKVNIFGK